MSSITKLLLNNPKPVSDHSKPRSKCQVSSGTVAKLSTKPMLALSQLQLDNGISLNLTLAKSSFIELSSAIIRLNPSIILEGCRQAKVFTKTSKPVDAVIRVVWKHLWDKFRNRTSKGYEHLHEVEAVTGSN